ncbi:MAG: molybdopterin-dependent oxidoreductase, partial [Bauldia litoralis]
MSDRRLVRTAAHWGVYDAEVVDGRVVALHPVSADPDPSPIGRSLADVLDHPVRVREPMVRRGWLDNGPGDAGRRRGGEPFVPVDWETALKLVADELARVRATHGDPAVFAGCYGWASAGCFHRAPSQLHRFMALDGGYTASLNTYSFGAAEVVMPHVLGDSIWGLYAQSTTYDVIAEHCDLMVAFGGIPLKNTQIQGGSAVNHSDRGWLRTCRDAGVAFVLVSPVAGDLADFLEAQWLRPRPNTDTALMMGLAHTLLSEGLHDPVFLDRYCTGFGAFRAYLSDGIAKDADWAAAIAGVDAEAIRALARRMAGGRTMINVSWSLQRADHGEQAYWMAVTLAAMLGQIGLPNNNIAFGYNTITKISAPVRQLPRPTLPINQNPT